MNFRYTKGKENIRKLHNQTKVDIQRKQIQPLQRNCQRKKVRANSIYLVEKDMINKANLVPEKKKEE